MAITNEQAEILNIMIGEKLKANDTQYVMALIQQTDDEKIVQMKAWLTAKKMQLQQVKVNNDAMNINIQKEIDKIDVMVA